MQKPAGSTSIHIDLFQRCTGNIVVGQVNEVPSET